MALAAEKRSDVGIEYPSNLKVLYPNGCSLAQDRTTMWKFPALTKPALFVICALAPDKEKFHSYYVQVTPNVVLDAQLKSLEVAGYQLKPAFSPETTTYDVFVPMETADVKVTAVADDANSEVQLGNADTMVSNSGHGSYTLSMPHNKAFGEGQTPIWSRELPVRVKKTDEKDPSRSIVQDYLITVHLQVSGSSFLRNLTIGDTPCTLDPPFQMHHFEYKCVFPWEKSEWASVIPTVDYPTCVDCKVRILDPEIVIEGHSHLNIEFQRTERTTWKDKAEWRKKFLFGEYHVLPIMVVSQDQYTSTTYNIYIERAAPWWMRTSTTRFISTSATSLAMIMSVASITNAMALVKQMQFMTLTAQITGCPPVYRDYANNLNEVNLDVGWMMPDWFGSLSPAAIKKYKNKLLREIKVDQEYCGKLKTDGKEVADAFARKHPHVFFTSDLMDMGEEALGTLGVNVTDAQNIKVWSSTFLSAIGRRLDESPTPPELHMKKVDCNGNAVESAKRVEDTIRNLEQIAKLMHGIVGNLLFLLFFLSTGLSSYWTYYFLVYKYKQTRLRSLEPGPLWLFCLDYCLIMFSSSAAKLMFRPSSSISLLGFHPSTFMISAAMLVSLVSYPVLFLTAIVFSMRYLQQETPARKPQLIWNARMGRYTDPECSSVNVSVPPPFPSFIPIFYQIFTQHIRACIPVKDEEGKHFYFLDQDVAKEAADVKKKKLDVSCMPEELVEEMTSLLKETNDDFEEMQKETEREKARKQRAEETREKSSLKRRASFLQSDDALAKMLENTETNQAPDWICEIFEEKPPNWNWMNSLHQDDYDQRKKNKACFESLIDVKNHLASQKDPPRGDDEKLEDEEIYALIQYVDSCIRKERRLLKYNILKCWPLDGYIKPLEPPPEDEFRDFRYGKGYLQNDLKERLVYPGDQAVSFPTITPHGKSGATLVWKAEPPEGWDEWEKTKKDMFYADKWQYVCFDHPAKPWYSDESGDVAWWTTLIPGYAKLQIVWRNRFAGRVPSKVDDDEKKEILKWFWVEQHPCLYMKIRLCFFADRHPKYGRFRSMEEIVSLDFYDAWEKIEHPELQANNEGALDGMRDPPSPSRERQRSTRHSLENPENDDPNELRDWTLMKFEDLHSEEPWWDGCDKEADGETKIMFDNEAFWNPNLEKSYLARNPHIPREGFWSSTVFTRFPEIQFGCKRYNLLKPDANRCNVEVKIKLKHILPLMRYVPRFKVNIPSDTLDMPMRNSLRIIISGKMKGQEYDYVFDRVATLMSILVLAAHAAGAVQAFTFLASKVMVLCNQMRSDYASLDEEKIKDPKTGIETTRPVPFFSNTVYNKYIGGDAFVWAMQTLTLLLLCLGFTNFIPAPLTALFCILLTSGTMIFMNARSFKTEIFRMVNDLEEQVQRAKARIFSLWYKANDLYNRMVGKKVEISSEFYSALTIDLIVPEIGAVFLGEPEVDPSLPPEEQREAGMKKELIYYSARPYLTHLPYRSVRLLDRFEIDIKTGMTFSMDIDQLCLKKKMPQVAATIQCLNHVENRICSPQYDSFLTLTKPADWEPEYDEDPEKLNGLLISWRDQLKNWLSKDLGAMRTDRTGTEDIIRQINTALEKEWGLSNSLTSARKMVRVKCISVQGVPYQATESGNQDFYVMLLKESEDPIESYPKQRITDTVTGTWEDAAHRFEGSTWDEELEVELGAGDVSVHFSVWDEDYLGSDFVGLTEPMSIETLSHEYGDPITIPLFKKNSRGGRVPIECAKEGGLLQSSTRTNDNVRATMTIQLRVYSPEEEEQDVQRRAWAMEFASSGKSNREQVEKLDEGQMLDMMRALNIRKKRAGLSVKEGEDGGKKAARKRTVNNEEITAEPGWDDDVELIDQVITALRKLENQSNISQKKVIHYVLLSDHLKPSRHWKPDAITPHVAQLIIKESEVVDVVMLQGCSSEKEYMNGIFTKQEHPCCGRPSYKHADKDIFIYYDGEERWLISPTQGGSLCCEPGYHFVMDSLAQTPDKIDQPFNFWEGNAWQCDTRMYCYEYDRSIETASWFYKTFLARVYKSPFEDVIETGTDNAMSYMRMVARRIYELVSVEATKTKEMKTVIRDCLASMNASGLAFRWRDINIDYLAPFRKYLLTNFESYERAWTVVIGRHLQVPDAEAVDAIKEHILEKIEHPDYQDLRSLDPVQIVSTLKGNEQKLSVDSAKLLFTTKCPDQYLEFKRYLREESEYDTFESFWALLSSEQELSIDGFYQGCKSLLKSFDPETCCTEQATRSLSDRYFEYFDAQGSGGISFQELQPASGPLLDDVDKSLLMFKVPIEFLRVVELDHKLHRVKVRANSKFINQPEWKKLRKALDPDWKVDDVENEFLQFQCRDTFFDLWTTVVTASDMTRKQAWITHYDGQINEHPRIPGTYVRLGFGEQRWSNGSVYQGNWKNHLPHGEGKLWRTVDDITNPDAKPIYDGQWKNGYREGTGILRWEQSTQERKVSDQVMSAIFASNRCNGIQKVYNGEFKNDLFNGEGELFVENGTVTRVQHGQQTDGYLPLPQIDPSQILIFKGTFSSDWEFTKYYMKDVYGIDWGDLNLNIQDIDCKDFDGEGGKRIPNRKFQKYLGSDGRVQLAGMPPRDFALDLYSMKGGDIIHMAYGAVEYADGSLYQGSMSQGRPDGHGKLTQRRSKQTVSTSATEFELLQEYEGDWQLGEKDGEGNLIDHVSGLHYTGQWVKNKKEGVGVMEVPDSLAAEMGYRRYEGDWKENKRDGEGKLVLENRSEYEGEFKDNQRFGVGALREAGASASEKHINVEYADKLEVRNDLLELSGGVGKLLILERLWEPKKVEETGKKQKKKKGDQEVVKERAAGEGKAFEAGVTPGMYISTINGLKNFRQRTPNAVFLDYADNEPLAVVFVSLNDSLYNGNWKNDECYTTENKPAWLLLEDERLYYGQVNSNGIREGHGLLYSKTKTDCDALLLRAWHVNEAFQLPIGVNEKTKHEWIVYEGQWKNNLPHGDGSQFAPLATYTGQFRDGMRHGKGDFSTLDGTFKYLPTDTPNGNWSRDKMHGVATVERDNFVHSNVIYKDNECQMPYSEGGPPTTGFDGNKVLGPVVNKVLNPKLNIVRKKVTKITDSRTDVDFQQIASTQSFRKAIDIKTDKHELRKTVGKNANFLHVINEPTDYIPPEEDAFVYGGTGENEIMNGLYFRQMAKFGDVAYKRYVVGEDGKGVARYLFRNPQGNKWIISDAPETGDVPIEPAPGTAWVQGSTVNPAEIVGTWHVYHKHKDVAKYKPYRRLGESDLLVKKEVDRLKVKVVEGFSLVASTDGLMNGIFLRQPNEVYDRPVYEVENGGQFLFWSQTEQSDDEESKTSKQMPGTPRKSSQEMHLQIGVWVIGDHLGATPKGAQDGCWAYCEDSAVTPDMISKNHHWIVYRNDEWVIDKELKLEMFERDKNAASEIGLPPLMDVDKTTTGESSGPSRPETSMEAYSSRMLSGAE
eukprot:GEMP01000055.1.p1 GENE.GEMP01000055.1~~GEMP01000055.1.p1  ORF type:complete len:3622 (-),score=620.69 GEMP01000055.1:1062-11450(-)